ncbi:MAG: sigma-70 family RNA polymerase sigma factor [Phycisphaerales bacterium]|nr:MAG: sigma-70 family RNA polymerase sigma factor [Phycisphaerales bacterium]
MKDARLVHRLRRGDVDALHQVYHRYKNDLLTVAMAVLCDPYAAEDCVHDVFVHFATTPSDLRANRNLRGYLMRSVANGARNWLSRERARPQPRADEQGRCRQCDNPARRLAVAEQSAQVFEALAQLPAEQREVISLHLHGQMTFREIAEALNLSINTVQSRYRYGIEKLRALL